jgi:hypothetical protein
MNSFDSESIDWTVEILLNSFWIDWVDDDDSISFNCSEEVMDARDMRASEGLEALTNLSIC